MKKSTAIGVLLMLGLGIVAAHSIGGIAPQPAVSPVPAAVKPMSPLQMMRHAHESEQPVDAAF